MPKFESMTERELLVGMQRYLQTELSIDQRQAAETVAKETLALWCRARRCFFDGFSVLQIFAAVENGRVPDISRSMIDLERLGLC